MSSVLICAVLLVLAVGFRLLSREDRFNEWTHFESDGTGPPPRLAHDAAAVGNSLYVHGGFHGLAETKVYDDLWRYDISGSAWEKLETTGEKPPGRLHHSVVATSNRDRLIVFGGFDDFLTKPHKALNDLYMFDLHTKHWTRLDNKMQAGTPMPSPRGGHEATCIGDDMYLFGGFSSIKRDGHSNELWRYSVKENMWTNLTSRSAKEDNWPEGRIGFPMVNLGNESIHIFSGGCESAGQCADEWVYDITAARWRKVTTVNTPPPRRGSHADVVIGDLLFLFGGMSMDGEPGPGKPPKNVKVFDTLTVLDLRTLRWMEVHSKFRRGLHPPPTFGHTVNRVGDSIVVFGGRIGGLTSPGSNDIWQFTYEPHH